MTPSRPPTTHDATAPTPLGGMRVLDFTNNLSGPFCTMMLADMGAEVIKIERPGGGDDSRAFGPFVNGESYAYQQVNRNKKSVVLDLKSDLGREASRRLALRSDVLVENFRPGVMGRLGLSYEALSAENPGLIYCSISGFGQTGPYAQRAGYDLIAQAMAGLMSVTGEPGRPPAKAGLPVCDVGSGMFAAFGIVTAYVERLRSGRGQRLETALYSVPVAWSVWEAAKYFGTGEVPGPTGSAHPLSAPYQAFRTRDSYLVLGANQANHFKALCQTIGAPELLEDPRFASVALRRRNLDVLAPLLEQALMARTTDEWIEALTAVGVPCGPIKPYDEVYADPHTLARGLVVDQDHPTMGRIKVIGPPVRYSRTPPRLERAPLYGEHTEEVLRSLGLADAAHSAD